MVSVTQDAIDETVDADGRGRDVPMPVRILLVLVGAGLFLVALALAFQFSWAKQLWPIADSRLSYIFLGSIAAAIAGPMIWIGATGEIRAAEAGAMDLLVMYLALAAFFLLLSRRNPESLASVQSRVGPSTLLIYSIGFLLMAAVAVGAYFYARRFEMEDSRKMPLIVRISFVVFALALVATAVALITKAQHVFPWPLSGPSSVVFGLIFLGAASYFAYAAFQPSWHAARGQLIGFLLYDLFLLWPFINHFSAVKPEHRLSLIIYTSVLIYSALLATYYLFISPTTRAWGASQSGLED